MSTIKPSTLPTWATNAGTRVAPTSPQQATGFSPSDKPPARWMNWLWGNLCDWAAYVNGLATDDSFLGASYTWTATHTWIGNAKFTTAPQHATVATRSVGLVVSEALLVSPSVGTNTGTNNDGNPQFDTTGVQVRRLGFKIPLGASLTGVTCAVVNGSSATCTLKLFKHDGTTGTATQLGATQSGTGGTVPLSITSGTGLPDTMSDLTFYFIDVTSADTSGTACLEKAAVQFSETNIVASAR